MKNFEIVINDFTLRGTRCSMCGHYRVQLKRGIWLCPGMLGSPMHGFGPRYCEETGEEADNRFKEFLAERGCTLDEYTQARSKTKLSVSSSCSSSSTSSSCATYNTTSQLSTGSKLETLSLKKVLLSFGGGTYRSQAKKPNFCPPPKTEYYDGTSWKT